MGVGILHSCNGEQGIDDILLQHDFSAKKAADIHEIKQHCPWVLQQEQPHQVNADSRKLLGLHHILHCQVAEPGKVHLRDVNPE